MTDYLEKFNTLLSLLSEVENQNDTNQNDFVSVLEKLNNIEELKKDDKNYHLQKNSLRQNQMTLDLFEMNKFEFKDLKKRFIEIKHILENIKIDFFISEFQKIIALNSTISKYTENLENSLKSAFSEMHIIFSTNKMSLKPNSSNHFFNTIIGLNLSIFNRLEVLKRNYEEIKVELQSQLNLIKENKNLHYQERLKEETSLLFKKFNTDLESIIKTYELKLGNLALDQEKMQKSTSLLTTEVHSALEEIKTLNEKTQSLEIEYSRIVTTETKKIQDKLSINQTNFEIETNNIIKNITEKTEQELSDVQKNLEAQTNKIIENITQKSQELESSHAAFKELVEKAGIYDLTKNYEKKASEEKIEYQNYRNYTTWSILAAIITTILILGLPIWEYWGVNPPVDTNFFTLSARLTISIMFFVLALYLSKQAAKHYECYQENMRTFLQLAALEPFIARMSDEDKLSIRKVLIPTYFNQNKDGKYSSQESEVDLSANVTSLIHKLIDTVHENKFIKTNTSSQDKKDL